jgi:phosphoribosylaminoimidazole-succinocarboxamide synthase
LIDNGFQGKDGQQIPEMNEAWTTEISERYIELYEKVTGKNFEKTEEKSDSQIIDIISESLNKI